MRSGLRGALALALAVGLVNLPLIAVTHAALGFVLASQAAQLDGINAVQGANVYAGEVISTFPKGVLRVQSTGNQIYLLPSSQATMAGDDGAMSAVLTTGIAGFTSAQDGKVSIRALDVLVRPGAAQGVEGRVEVAGPEQLLVASIHGPLDLELDGAVYTVADGKAYRVNIEQENPKSMDAGKHPAKRRRKLVFLIFGGAVGGYVALQLYHELTESPDVP